MAQQKATKVAIGGGIAGLGLALNLHQRGTDCTVYESAPEIKELGVGITLLPHAMRELTALGLQDVLRKVAIENGESRFFNRFGQLIYKEPRGVVAGYRYPEFGFHRGRLHLTMVQAAQEVLGAELPVKIAAGFQQIALNTDESAGRHGQRTPRKTKLSAN